MTVRGRFIPYYFGCLAAIFEGCATLGVFSPLLPGTVTYARLFSLKEFTFLFEQAKPYWSMCW